MAAAGGGSAYARLQVPQDGMNQTLQYWGARKAKENDDEKLADERAQIRKDKALSDWEDKYGLKAEDFQNKYTGFKSFDDMNTDFSMYASKEYVNLQRQAKEAMMNGDRGKQLNLESQMIRLKGAFGEAAKSQEFFAEKFKDYQKAVSEGRVSGASKDFEDIVQEAIVNKNVALRMQDGNLVYTGIKTNDKGQKEPFVIPYQDLMDGSFGYYEKQQVSGKGGLVDNILSDLGKITREGSQGYYNITTQAWDDGEDAGIHTKATEEAIDALIGNDEIMGDLLYQFSQGKTSKMFGFDKKDYDLVKSKMKDLVRAGYNEKFSSQFNASKYATDAANARANKKKDEDSSLSNLHFDANRFVNGDYTGLLGRHETAFGEVNIREVIPAPNGSYVVAVTDSGERIEVPKTKRGFLEFKIRNKPEYKNLTPEKVLEVEPIAYRQGSIGGAPIVNIAKDMFNEEGKPKYNDEEFLKRLNESFGIEGEDVFSWSGNSLVINGQPVDTSSRQAFVRTMEQAMSGKQKLNW